MFSKTCVLALCAALFVPVTATAQDPGDMVDASIIPGWRKSDGTHMAGLRLSLAPGWKTYWRSPGDAGIPPLFDWTSSGNISGVDVLWPVPEVFSQNGMRSVGYSGDVVFPIRIRPEDSADGILLAGEIDIGVCEDVCVPVTLSVRAELPADATRPDPRVGAAIADRPLSANEAGVRSVACQLQPIEDGLRLTARIDMPEIGRDESVVVELPDPAIWVSEPRTNRRGDLLTTTANLVPPDTRPFAVARDQMRFTVLADGRAVDIRGCS